MSSKQRFDVEPALEKISPHIPDEEINFLFPFRKFNTQGRRRKFKTSQLYRAHILAMLRGIPSFNKLCTELKARRAFRDFCLFKNKKLTPPKRMLSEFRDHLKPSGFEKITQLIAANLLNVISLPDVHVAIPDATDMPANCSGFAKKNAIVLAIANAQRSTPQREPRKGSERKKVVKVPILLDTRSILYVSGYESRGKTA
jgi:hypothetical protein